MSKETEIKANTYLPPRSKNPFTRKKVGKSMHSMLDGTFLTRDKFKRALPFILFLMVLGVLYISNIFHVERTKRQIDDLEEELRELRYEYISSRSKLMYESKPSEIVIKLEETGIRETMVPPRKIMVSKDNKTE
jgi:hypothetical protein